MRRITMDCSAIHSESEFWDQYLKLIDAESARFFGRNLNAFRDALLGGGPGWPGECELELVNAQQLPPLFREGLEGIARQSTSEKVTLA